MDILNRSRTLALAVIFLEPHRGFVKVERLTSRDGVADSLTYSPLNTTTGSREKGRQTGLEATLKLCGGAADVIDGRNRQRRGIPDVATIWSRWPGLRNLSQEASTSIRAPPSLGLCGTFEIARMLADH